MKITKYKLNFLVFILIISFISPIKTLSYNIGINYTSVSRNKVWQSPVNDGQICGSTGKCTPLKGIKVNLVKDSNIKGDIYYSVYSKKYGWTKYVSSGNVAGNLNNNIEAIKIKLTGDLEKNYNIFYRAHIQDYGWLAWARNDDIAGSLDANLRLEAIQIRLIKNDVVPNLDNSSTLSSMVLDMHNKTIKEINSRSTTLSLNNEYFFKIPEYNVFSGINADVWNNYIHIKENVDNKIRNVASYRIAALLGLDDLIAKSQYITLRNYNRKNVQGNLMWKVQGGIDFFPFKSIKNKTISPSLQCSLANLKIFDALISQVDRYPWNYSIIPSNFTKRAIRVVGYDNDLTFGNVNDLKNFSYWGSPIINSSNLISLPHMDKKLANNILNTTDNQIRAALFDILEKEYIDSTINRLHQLQAAIKNSIKEELDSKYYSYLKLFRDKINEP